MHMYERVAVGRKNPSPTLLKICLLWNFAQGIILMIYERGDTSRCLLQILYY